MSKKILIASTLGILLFAGCTSINSNTSDSSKKNLSEEDTVIDTVSTASASGIAIWQYPDKRELDPDLFGTPDNPLNVDLLPLEDRLTNEAGTEYTTIANPSMFSNVIEEIEGSINIWVNDRTYRDDPDSQDEAKIEAIFTGPNGQEFKILLNKVIPVGPSHQFFGGVATNVVMHGDTGIGTPLVTKELSYITLWGVGDLYIDGELADSNRIVHMMVSERTRDEDFKVGFDVAQPDELEIHLALPPQKASSDGPVDSPVPTGVILENGQEQPFIHVNFYGNLNLDGEQFDI